MTPARLIRITLFMGMTGAMMVPGLIRGELIAHWPLDETTGDQVIDASGHGSAALRQGEATWVPSGGRRGGAIRFGQHASDRIEVPMTGMSAVQGTLSLWVNLAPDPPLVGDQYLFGHGRAPFWSNRIQLHLDSQTRLLCLGLGDSHTRAIRIRVLEPEIWYHIALTWQRGQYALYINGVPAVTGAYTGLDNLNTVADIGNDGRNDGTQRNETIQGCMDDIALFGHALTQKEIIELQHGADVFACDEFGTLLSRLSRIDTLRKTRSPRSLISFLEKEIADQKQVVMKSPSPMRPHLKRLICELHYQLGQARVEAGLPIPETIRAYQQSVSELQYRPNYVPAVLWLSENASRGDYVDAIAASLREEAGPPANLDRVATDFARSQNWEAFEQYLETVIAKSKDCTVFLDEMSAGLMGNRWWRDRFDIYVQTKPRLASYLLRKYSDEARARVQSSDFDTALDFYQKAARQCRDGETGADCELAMCTCLAMAGEWSQALTMLDELIERDGRNNTSIYARAVLLRARMHIQLGKPDRAYALFSELAERDSQYKECAAEATFSAGYCSLLQGNIASAETSLRKTIDAYPLSPYAKKAKLCLAQVID